MLDAILSELGDEEASERLTPQRLDSLGHPARRDSLRTAPADLAGHPLSIFRYRPEFDLSSDSYREMVATGSLRIVTHDQLRSSIMRYYRVAEDQGQNEHGDERPPGARVGVEITARA